MNFGEGETISVVAGVLWRDGACLLCQRPVGKQHSGAWEFPGGKVEGDEGVLAAVRRELGEELGIQVVSIGGCLFTSRDLGSPFVVSFYRVEWKGDPAPLEHDELRWVSPQGVDAYLLTPASRAFVDTMLHQL